MIKAKLLDFIEEGFSSFKIFVFQKIKPFGPSWLCSAYSTCKVYTLEVRKNAFSWRVNSFVEINEINLILNPMVFS